MSYIVKDYRTGKKIVRGRPIVSLTLAPLIVEALDDFARKRGVSRSEAAELLIAYGLEKVKREEAQKTEKSENVREEKDEGSGERYMRKVIFDKDDGSNWVQVM